MKHLLRKNFSLMLALRYLNPLRTFFSVISLMCLGGVALGVMVLIVVLSVMGGLQRQLKERYLAYAPHITVNYSPSEGVLSYMQDWREIVKTLEKEPLVESAYPQIEDFVLVDSHGFQKPSMFRAIDTENKHQMEQLSNMVVDGTFDLGMGEEAVISSGLALNMGISLGDTLRIYAKRNYQDVINAYQQSEHSLKKQEAASLETLSKLPTTVTRTDTTESLDTAKVKTLHALFDGWIERPTLRPSEMEHVVALLELLDSGKDTDGKTTFSKGFSEQFAQSINALRTLDTDAEDLASFLNVKDLVLPRDLTIVGIYQSSRHLASPEIFVPLNLGQELLGLEDAAQGIAVRARDPHNLAPVEERVRALLPPLAPDQGTWIVQNWMANPTVATFVNLMQQERVMISFVLFFITLVAAFCIMAVMFAMSIQRKKEIAVMRALGATPRQVVSVFLWQGAIIGILGALSGIGLGFLVLKYRVEIRNFLVGINFDPFPVNFHGVELPCYIDYNEIALIALLSFIMVVCASIVPALLTARQDPAKSLRSL